MTPTSLLLIPPTAHHPTAAVSQGQKEGDGKVESRNAGTKYRFCAITEDTTARRPHSLHDTELYYLVSRPIVLRRQSSTAAPLVAVVVSATSYTAPCADHYTSRAHPTSKSPPLPQKTTPEATDCKATSRPRG